MDKYVIRLKRPEANSSILVCVDQDNIIRFSDRFTSHLKQFDAPSEAYRFIKKHKLERKGTTALVIRISEILSESPSTDHLTAGISKIKQTMYYIFDPTNGKKVCYNNIRNQYCLMSTENLYCLWKPEHIGLALKNMIGALGNPNLLQQSIEKYE